MSQKLKVIFAGTPDFAARHLQALLDASFETIAVYTQPDRPAGRGKKLQASPVKQLAEQHGLAVYQPASLRSAEEQAKLDQLGADLMVVVAYGLLLPQAVLDAPRLGCINVHGSLLPRWRGAAPIQRSIWAGDKETGVTIMQMDLGLDTGDMLHKVSLPIESDDTSASMYDKLAELGPKALIDTMHKIASGDINPEPQDNELANYAEKLSKQEAELDWQKDANALEREIRAFNPWPCSYFSVLGNNVKVWQASVIADKPSAQPGTILEASKAGIQVATAEGILNITSLQPPGKKAMSAQDFVNARADWIKVGTVLSSPNES